MAAYYICKIVHRTTFVVKANSEEEAENYCYECNIDDLEQKSGVSCDWDFHVDRLAVDSELEDPGLGYVVDLL